ncbi:hypothetical protein PIB30_082894 [Stylosanthes scabra]|uniref:Uncharacterized protein n=1 Tax=Stylosanthes scabra TaxID=79078 RepID=A0ABU6VQX9_9FABA|nr:hypothetical protein [Stylosanthes scabra]
MARKAPSPLAKGKAKIHQLPIRLSLRLAALRARQPIDKAGASVSTPAVTLRRIWTLRVAAPKKRILKWIPKEKIKGVNSSDESEEVPKYVPGDGLEENQDLGEEEPKEEGLGVDHEMDPNQDPEKPEEDPEEDPKEDLEMEEEEAEVMEPDEEEYN